MQGAIVSDKKTSLRWSPKIAKKLLGFLSLWLLFLTITLILYGHTSIYFWKNTIPVSGDGLLIVFLIDQLLEVTWPDFLTGNVVIEDLGWPGKSELFLFPIGNMLDMSIIKVLGNFLFAEQTNQLFVTYVMLRFPSTALITYYCLKTFQFGKLDRLMVTLLFTYSPFMLTRAEGHFVLASTWTIPIFATCFFQLSRLSISKKTRNFAFLGLFIVGLNNLYIAIFSILIMFIVIFWRVLDDILNAFNIPATLMRNRRALVGIIACMSALVLQVGPNLLHQANTTITYSLGKRGPIEGYIYAGDLLTLFSDLGRMVFSVVGRPDLKAFLESRITWEASQFGVLGSLMLLAILIVPVRHIWRRRGINFSDVESQTLFLYGILSVTLFLYLRNPFTSFFTAYIGGIRAWGRVIPIIYFVVLVLLVHLLRQQKGLKLASAVLVVLPLTWIQLHQFRESRPPAIQLTSQNKVSDKTLIETFSSNELNLIRSRECPVAVLPVHPFPEFDYPEDNASDYWQLRFPLLLQNESKWSVGALKNSSSYRYWQFLQSEVPPFQRASIYTQVKYSVNLNPCLIVIDKSALSNTERDKLNNELENSHLAFKKLFSNFNCLSNNQEFLIIRVNDCDTRSKAKSVNIYGYIASRIRGQNFLWQNLTSGSAGFKGMFQMFPSENSQKFKLIPLKGEKASFRALVKAEGLVYPNSLSLCVEQNDIKSCSSLVPLKSNIFVADFKMQLSQETTLDFSVIDHERHHGQIGLILVTNT